MKYLGIHKLIWLLIVICITFLQSIILFIIPYIFYILWNFKLSKEDFKWKNIFYTTEEDSIFSEIIRDRNIINTISRQYHIFFN